MVGIGYDIESQEYAAYNTWDNEIHWYPWSGIYMGENWSIYQLITFDIYCDAIVDECGVCDGNGPEIFYDCDGICINNSDNDALCDEEDNCPEDTNFSQSDSDGDGVGNACDNCISVYNPNQIDTDSDGSGDACDSNGLNILDSHVSKKLLKKLTLLGRETTNNTSLQLHIYNDGSLEKKYVIK